LFFINRIDVLIVIYGYKANRFRYYYKFFKDLEGDMKRTGFFIVCAFFFVAAFATAAGAKDIKTGYIDVNRLVNNSDMGKAAAKEIKKLRKEKMAELDKKKAEIDDLESWIMDHKGDMDAVTKRKKLRKLADLKTEYKRMSDDAAEMIKRKNDDIVVKILSKALPLIREKAEKEGFGMIIKNADALIYVSKSVDITDDIIKELNNKLK